MWSEAGGVLSTWKSASISVQPQLEQGGSTWRLGDYFQRSKERSMNSLSHAFESTHTISSVRKTPTQTAPPSLPTTLPMSQPPPQEFLVRDSFQITKVIQNLIKHRSSGGKYPGNHMEKKILSFHFFLKPISWGLRQCPKSQIRKQSQAHFCRLKVTWAKCLYWFLSFLGFFLWREETCPIGNGLRVLWVAVGGWAGHNHLQIRLAWCPNPFSKSSLPDFGG